MYVTAKDGYSNGKLGSQGLELMDKEKTLSLVGASRVMVIKIIQQIDTSIEMVEEATA